MNKNFVIWPKPIQEKIFSYESKHFTESETRAYLINLISDVEKVVLNPVISKTYTEEFGEFKGVSRIVVNKCKIYYEQIDNHIVIVAIKFPGEN